MRIATWNVNSVLARLPRLLQWLPTVNPDVVCLQETKCSVDGFPSHNLQELGYSAAVHGDGRWNGVALLSKVGLADVTLGFAGDPGFPAPEPRAISATCAGLRVWSIYAPNGRSPDDPHYAYKLAWLSALRSALAGELTVWGAAPFAVCGDVNIAPTDDDVWDASAFIGATHVTPAERQALAELRGLGLADVIPRPGKGDRPFTYWDYRAGMFHQNLGMRIDLVYGNSAFATSVTDAYVDREARKGKAPSDHAPVVVDVAASTASGPG
jgi:exodeoxyribonuclease III